MSYGVFEHLAATDEQAREVKNAGRAIVAARSRVERRFGTFIQKAASADERDERIRLVQDDLLGVVHAACVEHDYARHDEVQGVLTKVLAHLRTAGEKCSECGDACDDGEGWDGKCGNCADRDENAKEAAAPLPTGKDKKCQWCGGKGTDGSEECGPCKGSGWTKEKTADSNNPTSYQHKTEAPDKDTSLDTKTEGGRPDHIDVGSKRHPSEKQEADDEPTDKDYETDPLAASTNDAVTKTVNADTPIGSEETGPKTQTFDGGDTSAVTSKLRIV